MIKKIEIEIIDHKDHRPGIGECCGDWQFVRAETPGDSILKIRVSELPDKFHSYLIAHHELTEALGCYMYGVDEKKVDEFDSTWEPHDGLLEPGQDKDAPYHPFHVTAEICERIVAQMFQVDWTEYDNAIEGLFE
jgi:hypothetical protein